MRLPPVEVDVSGRCWHGCFAIWMGSPSVWRFHQPDGEYAFHLWTEDGQSTVIHGEDCHGDYCEDDGCWDEDEGEQNGEQNVPPRPDCLPR
jgi:hypothetical protein